METRNSSPFDLLARVEPLLVFLVFYLPGYLSQSTPISGRIFNSLSFNLTYLVEVLPRIALLFYLIVLRTQFTGSRDSERFTLRDYGVVPLRLADLGWMLLAFGAIEIVILPASIVGSAVGDAFGVARGSIFAPGVHWRLTNPAMLPVVFVTTMTVGYSEELFFRSYLLTRLRELGIGVTAAVAVSTVLFALGHIYEGLPGLIGTAAIGVILSALFLWKRNLHIIAIAHGLYNFVTLLATLSVGGAIR